MDCDLFDLFKREGGGLADATGNDVWMHALFHELLALAQNLACQQHDTGGAIADLRAGMVRQTLGIGRV